MKNKSKVFIIASIIILVLSVLYFKQDLSFSISGNSNDEYINTPVIAYFDCAPASSPVVSSKVAFNGYAERVKCPDNTDQCDLYIESEETSFFSLNRRVVYQVCSSSGCDTQNYEDADSDGWFVKSGIPTTVIYNLRKDQWVNINYQYCIGALGACIWADTKGASYYASYRPFILWKTSPLSGRKEYTSAEQGCVFPSSNVKLLVDAVSNIKGVSLTQTSTNDYKLEPYKTRNFIDGYVAMSSSNVNFVTYNGQNGYCLNRQIFSIATITTNGGTSKIVDSNFNNILGSVTCCPNEKEPTRKCGEDFQWHELSGSQCSLFNPCAGSNWYPSGQARQLVRYNCQNGYCVSENKNVECTTDNDCIGSSKGSYCDTLLYQCVNVAPPTQGNGTINDGKCASCDAYALSKLTFGFYKSCQPTALQGNTICILSFIKLLLIPLILIFGSLFGTEFFSEFKSIKRKKYVALILAIIVSIIIAYIVYISFFIGLILGIIYLVSKKIIKIIRG